jgi:hypothetical protein
MKMILKSIVMAAIVALPFAASADPGQSPNRVVMLSATAGAPFDTAGGHVFIFKRNENAATEEFATFAEFTFKNLHHLGSDRSAQSYGLYATTTSLGRVRLKTFNTSGGFTHSGFVGLPDAENDAWSWEDILFEVYVEEDDGFDAPDVGGLLVLEGFDPGY